LVGPLLGGVYAGRGDDLSLASTVPVLAAACRAEATLTGAVQAALARRTSSGGPVFGTIDGGVSRLVEAVAAASGAQLRLGAPVRSMARAAGGWGGGVGGRVGGAVRGHGGAAPFRRRSGGARACRTRAVAGRAAAGTGGGAGEPVGRGAAAVRAGAPGPGGARPCAARGHAGVGAGRGGLRRGGHPGLHQVGLGGCRAASTIGHMTSNAARINELNATIR